MPRASRFSRRAAHARVVARSHGRHGSRAVARALTASALLGGLASAAAGQSNLSSQGYGFPTGQLSTHSLATGGATAEMDPLSPVNPASLGALGTRILVFQIEPEFRTVTTANGSEGTRTARYPNVFGAIPVGPVTFSLGASTLLDRTSTTSFGSTQLLPSGESVPMTTTYQVDGAMDDLRLGAGWGPTRWLRLGIGAHAIVGRNLVKVTQAFADTVTFDQFTESRTLGFSGTALSAGAQIITSSWLAAASARRGFDMDVNVADTVLARGRVPNRFGASLAYIGIPNTAIAVRTSRDDWSSLGSMGSPNLVAVDAWDSSVGADVAGPRIGDRVIFLRAGYRDRTLPFEASGYKVTEQSVSGGLGTSFANGHLLGDLAVVHASRTASGLPASEHAWTLSIGLAVRP